MNRSIPKPLVLAAAMLLFAMGGAEMVHGSEVFEVWSRVYRQATSIQHRLAVMQNIVELDDPDLATLMHEALSELLQTRGQHMASADREHSRELMRLLMRGLANVRANQAAPLIFEVARNEDDAILAADALIALGRLRATQYSENITLMLRDLNLAPPANGREAAEIRAFGCISALEKMGGPQAYTQVFLASIGWYSGRIKNRASVALQFMAEDALQALSGLIEAGDSRIKVAALAAIEASPAPAHDKIAAANHALATGLRLKPANTIERSNLAELRSKAIGMLTGLRARAPESVPLLRDVLMLRHDMNEELAALTALGVNGSDEAVRLLSSLLEEQNRRSIAGLSAADIRFPTALMRALGLSRNPLARPALLAVEFSDYTPAMVQVSKEALRNLDSP